jgi:hypothetical protein
MASKQKVAAPASAGYQQTKNLNRAKTLKGKGNGRSSAETQELIDTLTSLLPADVKASLG